MTLCVMATCKYPFKCNVLDLAFIEPAATCDIWSLMRLPPLSASSCGKAGQSVSQSLLVPRQLSCCLHVASLDQHTATGRWPQAVMPYRRGTIELMT